MLPKSGSRLPKQQFSVTEKEFRNTIAEALKSELSDSHRAAKTIMAWTGVSDRTARAWLHAESSISGLHLIMLSSHCRAVTAAVLHLAGNDAIKPLVDLAAVEDQLTVILREIRQIRLS